MVMICLVPDYKQRKRYKKENRRFEYDILRDYFLLKNVGIEEKKKLIRYRVLCR
jgi:hypothetical protein